MASLARVLRDADPTTGWDLRYRVATFLLAALIAIPWGLILAPPVFGSTRTLADAPSNPVVGQVYYSPWSAYRYVYVSGYQLTVAKSKANRSGDRYTTLTWPQGRIAERSRFAYYYTSAGWKFAAAWVQATGPFSLWGLTCNVEYRYDGSSVFTDGSNRCGGHGIFYSVAIQPVTWNDGGRYWGGLQYGANYRVGAAVGGDIIFWDHWIRQSVYVNGTVGSVQGA